MTREGRARGRSRTAAPGRRWYRCAGTALAVVGLMASTGTAPARADRSGDGGSRDPVTVVAEGLEGPRQLSSWHGRLLVAEAEAGQVTAVDQRTGRTRVLVDDLVAPQGVLGVGGKLYIATGEAAPDDDPTAGGTSGLMVARPGGEPRLFADLTGYELTENPDGQTQFGPDGEPLDALSNPYHVIRDRSRHGFLLVADAGANAVLAVDRRGRVSTFFLPPTVTTGPCATAPNNNESGVGCDSVPTGLAYGPGGLLHISALTGEAPGEGRVYVVDRRGRLVHTYTGFTAPTGVAVDRRGTVYVSELFEGAPQGEEAPGPDFDPASVGQVVQVSPRGDERRYAQVTMPSGLLHEDGRLWASAWAVASFVGIPEGGQVVTVGSKAFQAEPAS